MFSISCRLSTDKKYLVPTDVTRIIRRKKRGKTSIVETDLTYIKVHEYIRRVIGDSFGRHPVVL
jgi:hypothetical protein